MPRSFTDCLMYVQYVQGAILSIFSGRFHKNPFFLWNWEVLPFKSYKTVTDKVISREYNCFCSLFYYICYKELWQYVGANGWNKNIHFSVHRIHILPAFTVHYLHYQVHILSMLTSIFKLSLTIGSVVTNFKSLLKLDFNNNEHNKTRNDYCE